MRGRPAAHFFCRRPSAAARFGRSPDGAVDDDGEAAAEHARGIEGQFLRVAHGLKSRVGEGAAVDAVAGNTADAIPMRVNVSIPIEAEAPAPAAVDPVPAESGEEEFPD